MSTGKEQIDGIFKVLGGSVSLGNSGLMVTSPCDGAAIAGLALDTASDVNHRVRYAITAQAAWRTLSRWQRISLLEAFSAAITAHRDSLASLIVTEAGKTQKEAYAEADGFADILLKTIKDSALPEFSGMIRCKERPPVGIVGLITSFNFPLVVAGWTLAPALLACNAVIWKPSEKTPLTALACKRIWDTIAGEHKDLLQVIIGGRDVGEALVVHEHIDMISATGSVAMGRAIKAVLAKKKNNNVKPILELGGNNGVIISDKMSSAHLEWAVQALMNSFLGTTGQRCTNTRRLIIHEKILDTAIAILQKHIGDFVAAGKTKWDEFGYNALIDADAYSRFEKAQQKVVGEGGKVLFGKRILVAEYLKGYYVEPALAVLPKQTDIMHEETFAPLLFVVPYIGDIQVAIALLNAPENSGLVSGIYTQNQQEADVFAAQSEAGHILINSPKGTGTPAFGMGFGGNKASGEGEILNAADPLRPFTRDTKFSRIAQNKDVKMDY